MDFNCSIQNLGWFHDRYREGTLEIRPPFQRKPVWAARQKCYLIESILMSLPIPEIFVQQKTSPEGKTTFVVVDGQQRIRSVLQFIGSERDPAESQYNKFSLDKLEADSAWYDYAFNDLQSEQRIAFFEYKFAVRYLNTGSDSEVRDMFKRLNMFLTPLNPQELRNATYKGPFISAAYELANNEYWAENKIVSPKSIRRMGDIQFVSELLIAVMHGPQGGSSKIVDDYYQQYEDFEEEFPEQRRAIRLFKATLDAVHRIFPEIKEIRWSNKTDFYSLFAAAASLLRNSELVETMVPQVRSRLVEFANDVDKRLGDQTADVGANVIQYVRAVEKGANDKPRRADRHEVLVNLLQPYFAPKK